MSTPSAPPPPTNNDSTPKPEPSTSTSPVATAEDIKMEATEPQVVEDPLPDDIANGTPDDILTRVRLIDNELRVS